jgi:hypothetical protein
MLFGVGSQFGEAVNARSQLADEVVEAREIGAGRREPSASVFEGKVMASNVSRLLNELASLLRPK